MLARLWWTPLLLALGCAPSPDAADAVDADPTTDSSSSTGPTTLATDTATALDTASPSDTGPLTDTGRAEHLDPHVMTWVPPEWSPQDVVRVVFLGDSITAGQGVFNPRSDYASLLVDNDDDNWPDHAEADLEARFPGLEVIDVSRSGATTEDVLATQLPAIEDQLGPVVSGTTLVVGTVGGNDIGDLLFGFGDVEAEVTRISDNVAAIANWFGDPTRFPDPTYTYLTNIYEPTDDQAQADECFYGIDVAFLQPAFLDINARTREAAQRDNWAWIDLYGHFLGHGMNYDEPEIEYYHPDDPTLWLASDCIHPNGRGHHEVRRLFLYAIDNEPLPRVDP